VQHDAQQMASELGVGTKQAGAGGGGLSSLLDMNGDGNALDDVLRLSSKVLR
jgi:hypothetical protein